MTNNAVDPRPLPSQARLTTLHCSFCGKDGEHVRFLTAGVWGGMICDVCCLKAFLIFVKAHFMAPFRLAKS
jgi:hypothetical protein